MNQLQIKKFPYTNILGWSVSRYDRFANCKRQYFYDYYAKFDKEIPYDKISRLKALTSTALETGNLTHDIIRDLLLRLKKCSKPIDKNKFIKYAFDLTDKYCTEKTFSEVYYKQKDKITASDIFPNIKKSLENFLQSGRLKWIFETALQTADNWIIEPDGFGETRIENYKAYCKVDYLIPVNDKIYILDWKTGRQDIQKHSKQLTGYALWAGYHFGKQSDDIAASIVYLLPDYNEYSVTLTGNDMNNFKKQAETETKQMYEYLTDIENNIPKPKSEFPVTSNEFFCKYCNYREICKSNF